MIRTLLAASTAALLVFVSPAFAHNGIVQLGKITISAPFMRATLPNAPVGGGYVTIENTGSEPDRLLSVKSGVSDDVGIHEMQMDGDVMKMRALDNGLEIPAGARITMGPGGYHLMFMHLKQPLVEGTKVVVTLTFEKAGTIDVPLPVLGAAAKAAEPMTMPMN